jgi:hypothetical protein
VESYLKFRKQLELLIVKEGLSLEQLYSCEKTSLNFKILPSITMAFHREK